MKIHCEQTDFGYLSVSRQTLTNVTFNRHLVASCSKLRSSNDYRQGEDVFKSTIFRTRGQSGMGELEMGTAWSSGIYGGEIPKKSLYIGVGTMVVISGILASIAK